MGDSASDSNEVSAHGRPSVIRPLQIRRKAQKSSLRLRQEAKDPVGKPLGSKNTGTDCFALSLFHILARQKEWMDAFHIVEHKGDHEPDTVVELFARFCKSLLNQVAISFPDLKKILHSGSLFFWCKWSRADARQHQA